MKIRSGFVSNSSSSSFICDVCGHDVSGMDMGLHEAEMYECVNGHVFCEEHAINMGDEKEMALNMIEQQLKDAEDAKDASYLKDYIEEYKETIETIKNDKDCDYQSILDENEFRYEMPALHCPICQMQIVQDDDMVAYLLKKNGLNKKDVKSDIQKEFNSFDDLKKYIND